jgi:hypothetical protein
MSPKQEAHWVACSLIPRYTLFITETRQMQYQVETGISPYRRNLPPPEPCSSLVMDILGRLTFSAGPRTPLDLRAAVPARWEGRYCRGTVIVLYTERGFFFDARGLCCVDEPVMG